MTERVRTGASAEYRALREGCGLLDHAGAGLFTAAGPGAAGFLGHTATLGVDFLPDGRTRAALLLREDATVVAEVLIHAVGGQYLVEVWPAQAAAVREHLTGLVSSRDDVVVTDVSDRYRVFGLEGPESALVVQKVLTFPPERGFAVTGSGEFVSWTAVSGEHGCRLHVPAAAADEVWQRLLGSGAVPCGTAALDLRRMENRFVNLEREASADGCDPFELGVQWMVDFDREFVGKEALLARRAERTARRPVCWVARQELTAVPPAGTPVRIGEHEVGTVAHAVFSPSLGRAIGIARVDRAVAASGLDFALGGPGHRIRTVSAPFTAAAGAGVPVD